MEQNTVMNAIYEETNKFGFGITVEQLIHRINWKLKDRGIDVCVLNERYLICNGCNYQLIKTRSKGHWTVKEF